MTHLSIHDLCTSYSGDRPIFDHFSLQIAENSFVAIIGPNGCGKTTLLKCIAGFLPYRHGRMVYADQPITNARIGFVFQNYRESLLPWLNNLENIVCTLDTTIEKNIDEIKKQADGLGVFVPWTKFPYECSGGQQQLVALLREMLNHPDVLLLDEPFSALDYEKRLLWRTQLLALWEKLKTTILFVSHDIEDAVYLADRVIVLGHTPAAIIGDVTIDLPRPRDTKVLRSEAFFHCRARVLELFLKAANMQNV